MPATTGGEENAHNVDADNAARTGAHAGRGRHGGGPIGEKYNGNGLAGAPVIWDPFKAYGNVIAGDRVGLKVCLVDGNSDPTPFSCNSYTHTSIDG